MDEILPRKPRGAKKVGKSQADSDAWSTLTPTTPATRWRSGSGHAGTAGSLVGDAHLAALALEHGATIVSFDRDFARFEGVTLRRPG